MPRILTKAIPSIQLDTDGSGLPIFHSDIVAGSGWEIVSGSGGSFALWTGYIDLTGMTVSQDLSMAVQAVEFQECFPTVCFASSLFVWDLVTDVPVDWNEALDNSDGSSDALPLPGFLGSHQNIENVVQGKFRFFSPGLTGTAAGANVSEGTIPIQANAWGVNAATASDRLYIARLVALAPNVDLTPAAILSPTICAMPVVFFEEKDLSHLERLRRSYVLQQ